MKTTIPGHRKGAPTWMVVTIPCPMCGYSTDVCVSRPSHNAWREGAPIQQAMPYLDANEREALITGICAECWDTHMTSDEEE
ncbi:MAG: hypothetical protein K0U53_01430 [Betaproteobacteria bacterium]|nr:hypothetical protein [Betaproteobacteria bacterium]